MDVRLASRMARMALLCVAVTLAGCAPAGVERHMRDSRLLVHSYRNVMASNSTFTEEEYKKMFGRNCAQ